MDTDDTKHVGAAEETGVDPDVTGAVEHDASAGDTADAADSDETDAASADSTSVDGLPETDDSTPPDAPPDAAASDAPAPPGPLDDEVSDSTATARMDALTHTLERHVSTLLSAIESTSREHERALEQIVNRVDAAGRRQLVETRELLSEADTLAHVNRISGFLRNLFQLVHTLDTLATGAQDDAPGHARNYQNLRRVLVTSLAGEGVEEVVPAVDLPFDPRFHQVTRVEPSGDQSRNLRVAEVVRPGFAIGSRSIQPAQVIVWKYDESLDDDSSREEPGRGGSADSHSDSNGGQDRPPHDQLGGHHGG